VLNRDVEVRLAEWYAVCGCILFRLDQTYRHGFTAIHSAVFGTTEGLVLYVSVTHEYIKYTQSLSYALVLPKKVGINKKKALINRFHQKYRFCVVECSQSKGVK
jgi:hypothetical protein